MIDETLRRGGSVLIPVFAFGKTQELLLMLHELFDEGHLPYTPVHIGGLSTRMTTITDSFSDHPGRHHRGYKLLDEFPLFSTAGAGRKNTCKHCSNHQATVRRRLRRQHPVPDPGECPSCGRHTDKWVLDHCHHTDKFRGYICDSCNVAFGKFNDDPFTMQRSLNWLQSHG